MASPATQAHLDTLARQLGFHDYATYQGYQQHQQMMRAQNPGSDMTDPNAGAPQQQGNNWLQNMIAKIPIHPAYLMGKVVDGFTKAGQ